MARQSIRLAEICPADIIAESTNTYDFESLDQSPRNFEELEYNIVQAVAALLPDELIIHESTRNDPDGGEATRFWYVLQGLDPATKTVSWRGREDDATPRFQDAVAWLSDLRRVGETISLDTLVRAAIRNAELALQADM